MATIVAIGMPNMKDGEAAPGDRMCVCSDDAVTPHVVRRVRPSDAVHANAEYGARLTLEGPWAQCTLCGAWVDIA